MIKVLVVDDDFRVAKVHAAFAGQVAGCTVVGTARTAAEATVKIAELQPDLVLLDVYLPDRSGLELLAELSVDAFILSAAADPRSVAAAFTAGAVNYLIKPFTAEQLHERLLAYQRYRGLITGDRELDQEDVDRAMKVRHGSNRVPGAASQPVTAQLITDLLRRAGQPKSTVEVADELGIARATAQRYLSGLVRAGSIAMRLRYGTTGRPEHLYWADLDRG